MSSESSRCAASSAMISSLSSRGRFKPAMRPRTCFFQSGMADSGQGVERLEKGSPLFAQRCQLAASGRSEAVVPAVASRLIRLPPAFDPSSFFHLVKQGIKRGEGELQGAAGSLPDLPGYLETVVWLLGQQGENGEFPAATRDLGTDASVHSNVGILCCEYRNPILKGKLPKASLSFINQDPP